jgi:hypothetical protein
VAAWEDRRRQGEKRAQELARRPPQDPPALCRFCRTPPDDAKWHYQHLLQQAQQVEAFLTLLRGMQLGVAMLNDV